MADEKPDDHKPDPNAPQYITAEALNKALDGRLKRFEAAVLKTFDGKVAELLAGRGAGGDDDQEGKGDGKKEGKGDDAGPLAEIGKRVKALEAENRKLKEKDTANEKKRFADEERALLADAYKKGGGNPLLADDWVAARHGEGTVVRDDAGEIVWRTKEGDKPVAAGTKEWLAGDRGKAYIPAKGGRGSANAPGANGVDQGQAGPLDDSGLLGHVL